MEQDFSRPQGRAFGEQHFWISSLVTYILFKGAVGAISFTTDMWSSKKRESYLCLTAHWLAYGRKDTQEDLQLRSAVIAFHRFTGRHTGENMGRTILQLLARAGIEKLTSVCKFQL
jgi:hypothetical protein